MQQLIIIRFVKEKNDADVVISAKKTLKNTYLRNLYASKYFL